ncbi:ABC transporter permease [Streptomyces violens]|uniref:ABC transporter permease n=1 Tax=Streptomyces violens TaxID=66377 RepID=UPI00068A1420|nr:FtsX-like permease family protein [Streptomyces violens]
MGARFAVTGGREGWFRTALSAIGVGIGVAVLLLACSAPTVLDAWHGREKARENLGQLHEPRASDRTVRYAQADTTFHGEPVRGRLVRPDGAHPPVPPGIKRLPGPGEMVVSPALRELLAEPGSAQLRARLDYKVVGTIGDNGLLGPRELTFVAGLDDRSAGEAYRISRFGKLFDPQPPSARLVLLTVLACVVLLMPVVVFIGTAVRFGGDRREARLAALRLVGADIPTTRRIAAGEAVVGAVLGLAAGLLFFLTGRQAVGAVTLWGVNVFPADVVPSPGLAALVAVLVPAASVLVTLFAQRSVTAEPLGVVRNRPVARRRLGWRLALPLTGLTLLLSLAWDPQAVVDDWFHVVRLALGAALLLLGVTALLPWLVEAVVARLRGGPVPWQLAVRRLQLNSGAAQRAVGGITVAVAGAIAIHMVFTTYQAGYAQAYEESARRPVIQLSGGTSDGQGTRDALATLRRAPGVTWAHGTVRASAAPAGDRGTRDPDGYRSVRTAMVTVGDCAELRRKARIGSCRDGDVFVTENRGDRATDPAFVRPGVRLNLNPPEGYEVTGPPRPWTVPDSARRVQGIRHPGEDLPGDVLATPGALSPARLQDPTMELVVGYDKAREAEAVERIRTVAFRVNPGLRELSAIDNPHDRQYDGVRTALFLGAVIVLLLIGAGLIVSTVEQLRERRRLLSVLDAFGTRRATVGWSLLWQTAIPVALGLALAVTAGIGLGTVLLTLSGAEVHLDGAVIAGIAGSAAGVVLLVTLLSLPPLWRMMRPDGLRTE